ncbi:hypothetical protein NXX82_22720 [Bacteroides fragilis]|nr:hypothetical protein [Bacteroides fragilis]
MAGWHLYEDCSAFDLRNTLFNVIIRKAEPEVWYVLNSGRQSMDSVRLAGCYAWEDDATDAGVQRLTYP